MRPGNDYHHIDVVGPAVAVDLLFKIREILDDENILFTFYCHLQSASLPRGRSLQLKNK